MASSFDLDSARQHYSDDEIQQFLLGQPGVADARKAGYSDQEILSHFGFSPGQQTEAAPSAINPPSTQTVSANPQISGPGRYVAGAASALAKGAAVGLGVPGDLESLATQGAAKLGLGNGDMSGGPWNTGTVLPTSSTLLETTGRLGLTDRADLIPGQGDYPTAEKLGSKAIEGVGSAVPALALGGATVPTLAAGGTGGLAGEAAHELLPGVPAAPIIAGLATGLGVQGVASTLAAQSIPRIAKSLGTSETWDQAGQAAQDSARDWLKTTLPAKQAAAWAPVDAAVPTTAGTPLTNFLSTLSNITTKAGGLQPVVDALSSKVPGNLLNLINNKTPVGLGIAPTWNEVQQLRSAVGNAMANPQVVKDIPAQQLSQLYGALTKDMKSTATANGAGAEFQAANAESTRLYGIAEGPIAKLVSGGKAADDPAPGKAAKSLLTSGRTTGSDLTSLRGEIPDAVDELAAAHLLQTPSGWTKLAPEAQAALVPDLALRARISHAVEASTGVSPALKDWHGLQSLIGGEAGKDVIAPLLGHFFPGLAGNPAIQAGTAGLGLMAPMAYRGAKAAIANPSLLRVPVTGAIGGSNALFPDEPSVTLGSPTLLPR